MRPTRAQLRLLIAESNAIEGIYNPVEIEQSLVAWDYLIKYKINLTHGVICKVQKIITLHQPELAGPKRGYYRDLTQINVRVGNYTAPHYSAVQGLMDNWLLDYAGLEPFEAHRRFEAIHPFVDGNGRTGRMLMWWQEVKAGKAPTIINADERQAYYKKLAIE